MPFIATSTLHFEHTRKNQTPMEKRLSSISKQLVSYQHLSFIPLLMFARYKVSPSARRPSHSHTYATSCAMPSQTCRQHPNPH